MTIEQCLDLAKSTGILNLKCTKKQNFSTWKSNKLFLDEVQTVDLSCNKLTKFPTECLVYYLMERLILSDNILTSIPKSFMVLKSLVILDLSRNQLKNLPIPICHLPFLEILVLSNNQLEEIPEEISLMKNLIELDVACNEVKHLPSEIGDVISLRSLNLRKNKLRKIPIEISFLPLVHLDLSSNDIVAIPVEFRFIDSLVHLSLEGNPLSSPPLNVCERGKLHVFKYLYEKAITEGNKLGSMRNRKYNRFNQNIEHSTKRGKRKPGIQANFVDADKYNKNIVRRRNAFRSAGENTDLPCNSTNNVVFNQMEYPDQTLIEEQDRKKSRNSSLPIQSSEDVQNISNYNEEKRSFLFKRVEERNLYNNKKTLQSMLSYQSNSTVSNAPTANLCTSIEKNNDDVDSRTKENISHVGQISFVECCFLFTLPMVFLVLSLYVIAEQIVNLKEDTHSESENNRKKIFM